MNTKPVLLCSVVCGTVLALAAACPADTVWPSNENSPLRVGTYVELGNAVDDRDGGSGGYNDITSGSRVPPNFIDFFDGTEYVRWDNVAVPALAEGQYLALQCRNGNPGHAVGHFSVDLYTPGAGYQGTPIARTAARFRSTGWDNFGDHGYLPALGSHIPAGNYDIQVTTSGGGSHFAGIGTYQTPVMLTPGASTQLEAEDYVWAWSASPNIQPDGAWPSGELLDSFQGSNWIDYEVYNPDERIEYTMSVHARGNLGSDVVLSMYLVDPLTGDVSPAVADVDLPAHFTGAWWDSPFTDSQLSAPFTLPEGYCVLRFQETGINHLDYFTLNASELQEIPEPATMLALVGGLAATGGYVRRRRRSR